MVNLYGYLKCYGFVLFGHVNFRIKVFLVVPEQRPMGNSQSGVVCKHKIRHAADLLSFLIDKRPSSYQAIRTHPPHMENNRGLIQECFGCSCQFPELAQIG